MSGFLELADAVEALSFLSEEAFFIQGSEINDAIHDLMPLPKVVVPLEYAWRLDRAWQVLPDGFYGRVEPRFYEDGHKILWRGYAIRPRWDDWSPVNIDWFDVFEAIDVGRPEQALCAAALRARASLSPAAVMSTSPGDHQNHVGPAFSASSGTDTVGAEGISHD